MFAGPLSEVKPWSTNGLDGARRFIERVYRLVDEEPYCSLLSDENDGSLDYAYNAMIQKVTKDFEDLSFNTAISAMMVFVNECYKAKKLYRPYIEGLVQVFSCVCPFVGEEMWQKLGHEELLTYHPWPKVDATKLVKETVKLAVSVNGKMRDVMELPRDIAQEEAVALAKANPKIVPWIEGKTIKKIIFVPGRILNIVAL